MDLIAPPRQSVVGRFFWWDRENFHCVFPPEQNSEKNIWRERTHWSDPLSGGGPLCMPLCYWATQTAVAPIDLCVGLGRLALKPYLPPHKAATVIQRAYLSHCL